MIYRVISLDVWGNPKDGYEVNDKWRSAFSIEFDEDTENKEIIEKLIEVGYLNFRARKNAEVEWLDDGQYGINDKKDGKYICELSLEER